MVSLAMRLRVSQSESQREQEEAIGFLSEGTAGYSTPGYRATIVSDQHWKQVSTPERVISQDGTEGADQNEEDQ